MPPMIPLFSLFRRHALRIILLSAGVLVLLASPPAFSETLPRHGLWVCITGTGLFVCAIFSPLAQPASRHEKEGNLRSLLGIAIASLFWIAMLIPAGWITATFLAGVFACRKAGCSWKESLLLPAILCLLLYAGIVCILEWPLPEGLFLNTFFGVSPWTP